jgi:two-component system, NtrC family, sensor histidine kinase GlrK
MKLTIFSRLFIGYFIIFILVILLGIYNHSQLNKLEANILSITNIDNRLLDYNKKLMNTFLSEAQNEKKYIITKDKIFYNHFLSSVSEFNAHLKENKVLATTEPFRNLLDEIEASHQQYVTLCNEEFDLLQNNKRYSRAEFASQKEVISSLLLEQLKEFKSLIETNSYETIKRLGIEGMNVRKINIIMTAVTLILSFTIAVFITRSITKPITIMRKKTRDIAKGLYSRQIKLSSLPEMNELAADFNDMCRKLMETDRIKSDFFSLMSHELRTPLTSIKEGTNLLLEGMGGVINDKQKKLLTIIKEESNRLINLVNSILDLSKMEAGMAEYRFVQADVIPLIDKTLTEIEPIIKAKNITMEVLTPQDIPHLRIDPERILQALRNLIGNAIKFSPKRGTIRIQAVRKQTTVEISVSDSGPGISSEELQRIFDKFQSPKMGTGLGLAIVKNIIQSHGGKIWAESTPGKGSTFIFSLPV